MQNLDYTTIDVIKVTELENCGVQSRSIARIAIGFILSGKKYIHFNDKCYLINEGDMFLLEQGFHYEENTIGNNGKFEQIVFYISAESLQETIFSLSLNYGIAFTSHHTCQECVAHNFTSMKVDRMLQNFFNGIDSSLRYKELLHNDVGQRIKLNELIYLILSGENECLKRRILRSSDTELEHFVRTIHENAFNDISIEMLATLTNRSLTSFKKAFRKTFNLSPHRWIIEQRLRRARILLSSTHKTVSEVGAECSFSNISHFIKLFKAKYGITPLLYRQHHRDIEGL